MDGGTATSVGGPVHIVGSGAPPITPFGGEEREKEEERSMQGERRGLMAAGRSGEE